MFADACEKMMRCTFPIMASRHFVDGRTESGIGAFVVINPEGWALSAAHVLMSVIKHKECREKILEVERWNAAHPDQPRSPDGSWSDLHSFWFGIPGVNIETAYINTELDLALFKLTDFKSEYVKEYPTFKDPNKLRAGTSVCRLGFPFISSPTAFDEEKRIFFVKPGILPVPFFPNDGMYTRTISRGKTKEYGFDRLMLETTTPGLRGQSGGPIFDRSGNIVGIQSCTAHMKMGFEVNKRPGEDSPEQYLHLGLGVHVRTITQVLEKNGVKYKSEANNDGYRIIG